MAIIRRQDPFVPKSLSDAVRLAKWRKRQSRVERGLEAAKPPRVEIPPIIEEPWVEDAKVAPRPRKGRDGS